MKPVPGTKARRFDFYPDDYIAGVGGKLNAREQGVYWMVCALIMSHQGPIKEDFAWLARLLKMRKGEVELALDALVLVHEKLHRNGGELDNKRARNEVERALNRISTSQQNGAGGGRPSKNRNGLAKPGGYSSGLPTTINHHTAEEKGTSVPFDRDAREGQSSGSPIIDATGRNVPQSPAPAEPPPPDRRARSKPPRKPLELDAEMRQWCADNCPGVDPDREMAKHLDWKLANGKAFKDDRAGFRTWMGRATSSTAAVAHANGHHSPANIERGDDYVRFGNRTRELSPQEKLSAAGRRVAHKLADLAGYDHEPDATVLGQPLRLPDDRDYDRRLDDRAEGAPAGSHPGRPSEMAPRSGNGYPGAKDR